MLLISTLPKLSFSSAPYRNAHFILEPCGRNTAPAVTLACLRCDPNEIVLVVPSDHIIQNEEAYRSAVQRAKMAAQEGFLVTFGLTPEYPETGYGYIEADTSHVSQGKSQGKVIELTEAGQKHVTTVAANSDQGYFPIRSFKEKPDRQTAEAYIETGNYFWNSGMFAFRAGTFLEEISKTSSAILEGAKAALTSASYTQTPEGYEVLRIDRHAMQSIPSDSIDYAVMEKSARGAVVPCSLGWNDLGSWDSIWNIREKTDPSSLQGAHTLTVNAANNLVVESNRHIAMVDVEGLIVVDTPDALLIVKRGSSQEVKKWSISSKKKAIHICSNCSIG